MPKITSLDGLNRLKVELVMKRNEEASRGAVRIAVGMGTCGIAAGAREVFRAFEEAIQSNALQDVTLIATGCIGLCKHEPIVEVTMGKAEQVSYGEVTPAIVERIVKEHVLDGRVVADFTIDTTPFPTM